MISRGDDGDSCAKSVNLGSEPGGRNRGHGKSYHSSSAGSSRRCANCGQPACSGDCRVNVSAGRGGFDGGDCGTSFAADLRHHDGQTGGGLQRRRVVAARVAGVRAQGLRSASRPSRRAARSRSKRPATAALADDDPGAGRAASQSRLATAPAPDPLDAQSVRVRAARGATPSARPRLARTRRRRVEPLLPAEPAIELVGVAEDSRADEDRPHGDHLGAEGDTVPGERRGARSRGGIAVKAVGADAVELIDLLTGDDPPARAASLTTGHRLASPTSASRSSS